MLIISYFIMANPISFLPPAMKDNCDSISELKLLRHYLNTDLAQSNITIAGEIAANLVTSGNYNLLNMFVSEMDRRKLQLLKESEKFLRALIALTFHLKDYKGVYRLMEEGLFVNKSGLLEIWDEAHYMEKEDELSKPLTPLIRFRLRKRHPPPSSISLGGVRPTLKLSDKSKAVLQSWLDQHSNKPYPDFEARASLAKFAGLSVCQVKTWFANARRHKKKLGKPTKSHKKLQKNKSYKTEINQPQDKITKCEKSPVAAKDEESLPTNDTKEGETLPENEIKVGESLPENEIKVTEHMPANDNYIPNLSNTPNKDNCHSISHLLFSPSSGNPLEQQTIASMNSDNRESPIPMTSCSLPSFSAMFDCGVASSVLVAQSPTHFTGGYDIPVHRGREFEAAQVLPFEPGPGLPFVTPPYTHYQQHRTWQPIGEPSTPALWHRPTTIAYPYPSGSGPYNGCSGIMSSGKPTYRWYSSPASSQMLHTATLPDVVASLQNNQMEYLPRTHVETMTQLRPPTARVVSASHMSDMWSRTQPHSPGISLPPLPAPQRYGSYHDVHPNGNNNCPSWNQRGRLNNETDRWLEIPCQPGGVFYTGHTMKPEPDHDVAQTLLELSSKSGMGATRQHSNMANSFVQDSISGNRNVFDSGHAMKH